MRMQKKDGKKLRLRQSTVDESGVSPNDDVGKVLGKEHSRRVRCLELGATPSTTFKQANLHVGDIRIPSSDVCSSFGCQEKYDQLLNTLEEYMIMKGKGQYRNNLFLFSSPPTMEELKNWNCIFLRIRTLKLGNSTCISSSYIHCFFLPLLRFIVNSSIISLELIQICSVMTVSKFFSKHI